MKYKDLISYQPVEEIVKFSNLDNGDYSRNIVKTFVYSKKYEEILIPTICDNLDYTQNKETFGLQIVGNYGTGKSHLMSLFSIIAENSDYLQFVTNENIKKEFEKIAGKYKVARFELGNDQDLWNVVAYQIDKFLKNEGVSYSLTADNSLDTYSDKLKKMMAHFEQQFPDKGFMLVIDEMLSYLKGRSEPQKLNKDLQVLQALGQVSDKSKFRVVFGVQELIYTAPEFQFATDMLSRVHDRYKELPISKEDVQFIVQKRLLSKNEHQKQQIREHLNKFTKFFPAEFKSQMQHRRLYNQFNACKNSINFSLGVI